MHLSEAGAGYAIAASHALHRKDGERSRAKPLILSSHNHITIFKKTMYTRLLFPVRNPFLLVRFIFRKYRMRRIELRKLDVHAKALFA